MYLVLNEFYNINFTYYKNVKLYLIENSNPTVCICKIYLFNIHIYAKYNQASFSERVF